ncbi:Hypothetical protein PHPALM_11087 [Phytophthora palmivora]|uniref:Uncharacterized protein n=1 Tax=Phytophthora palmivora TaxID=4796 RepID=A0A2P4Y343_9STRA|nr:Hypothetical protein PHPALM_11087 [Phytophthora palmivora]
MQEQQKAEAQRKLLEEQKKKLQLEAAAAAAAKKQEMLEQQRKQKQQQLQAQQQALMQQQQQQRQQLLAQQQAQLTAQNQLRMNAAGQQQPATAIGAATSATMLAAGNGTATATPINGSGLSPTSLGASLQAPIDVSTSSSPGGTNTTNGMASLTPAQYRTFKLPEARKQQLTAQHAKLREQQQELIMQQSRAKTPSHQAKLAHQAQRLAQMINKISQQLVQCKLAEEYEQSKNMSVSATMSQPTLSQSTATPIALNKASTMNPENTASTTDTAVNGLTSTVPAAVTTTVVPGLTVSDTTSNAVKVDISPSPGTTAKVDESFTSVLPDMTGLGASEKLLTAVAAYEKHKPEVLKRGASRFSRIAITIGAKLNTSYVTT